MPTRTGTGTRYKSTYLEFPPDTTVAQWPSVDARLSDVGTSEIVQTKQGAVGTI